MAFDQVPLVDIAPMRSADLGARRAVARPVREICHEVGFMYVANTGIASALIENALAEAKRFFALPLADKMAIEIGKIGYHRGYVPMGAHALDDSGKYDPHEAFEIGLELPPDDPDFLAGNKLYGPNLWPAGLPDFRRHLYAYYEALVELGKLLFRCFALALDIREDFFDERIGKPFSGLRLNYYPPQEPGAVGIEAHTDYECFTILWQGDHGLEVRNPAGEWVAVPPLPGSFVINIGDMMQRWTNDYFVSTPHRVVNRTGRARYSMPFFYGANYDTIVRPIDRCTGPGNPPRYRPTKCGLWMEAMLAHAYAYRRADRDKLPDPEIGPVPEIEDTTTPEAAVD
jgi:isopenicillin N synthase-like dioxygenase